MFTITPIISKVGYSGDIIRTFTFSANVVHSDYPGVSVGFGGEPLVSLQRGTDLNEYIQMQYSHDQAFVTHMKNVLEFEYIKSQLVIEDQPAPVEVIIIPAVTLWERMTEAEGEQVEKIMQTQPFRVRQIFTTAQSYRSDHELWPLLQQTAITLFGVQRTAELLAQP